MKKKYSTQKGFSLIELIIVVSIIGIMTALLLVSARGGKHSRELKVASRGVTVALREAQNNALTGLTREDEDGNPLFPCGFLFSAAGGAYAVSYEYHDGPGCAQGIGVRTLSEYTLPPGAQFAADYDDFRFSVPTGLLVGEDLPEVQEVRITAAGTDKTVGICVYRSGRVKELNINETCEEE